MSVGQWLVAATAVAGSTAALSHLARAHRIKVVEKSMPIWRRPEIEPIAPEAERFVSELAIHSINNNLNIVWNAEVSHLEEYLSMRGYGFLHHSSKRWKPFSKKVRLRLHHTCLERFFTTSLNYKMATRSHLHAVYRRFSTPNDCW
jgi:hypothetical protein